MIVAQSVKRILAGYRQFAPRQKESGGILLGYHREGSIFISRVTVPTSFDRATRTSFIRDSRIAQIFVEYEFANSGGKITYVGEWHTHPEPHPLPSSRDLRMIEEQFAENDLQVDHLVLLIMGTASEYVSAYDGRQHTKLTIDLRIK